MSRNFAFPREGVPQSERNKYGVGKRLESVGTVVGNRDFGKHGGTGSGCGMENLKAAGWGGDEESGGQIVGRKIGRGGGKCSSRNCDGNARSVDGKMEIGRRLRREAKVGMSGEGEVCGGDDWRGWRCCVLVAAAAAVAA